jgi:predicted nucleic acid-binding protein
VIYLDTGCLVKLYYPEPDSPRVVAAVQGKPICYTRLHELEFTNALRLKLFAKNADVAQVSAAAQLVAADLTSGVLASPAADWDNVFNEAVALSTQHSASLGTRSLDILHCAIAKVIGTSEFVTTDARQQRLATAMGLTLVTI